MCWIRLSLEKQMLPYSLGNISHQLSAVFNCLFAHPGKAWLAYSTFLAKSTDRHTLACHLQEREKTGNMHFLMTLQSEVSTAYHKIHTFCVDSHFLVNSRSCVTASTIYFLGHVSHPPVFLHAHRVFFVSHTTRATFSINLKNRMHVNTWCYPPFLIHYSDSLLNGLLQVQNVTCLHSGAGRCSCILKCSFWNLHSGDRR